MLPKIIIVGPITIYIEKDGRNKILLDFLTTPKDEPLDDILLELLITELAYLCCLFCFSDLSCE